MIGPSERHRRFEQMRVELGTDPKWAHRERVADELRDEARQRDILAWREAERIRSLTKRQRRAMQRLAIWCHSGKCCIACVYRVRGDLLFATGGESNLSMLNKDRSPKWVENGTCWIGEQQRTSGRRDRVTVTCNCTHTTERRISIAAVMQALSDDTRNVRESAVSVLD